MNLLSLTSYGNAYKSISIKIMIGTSRLRSKTVLLELSISIWTVVSYPLTCLILMVVRSTSPLVDKVDVSILGASLYTVSVDSEMVLLLESSYPYLLFVDISIFEIYICKLIIIFNCY